MLCCVLMKLNLFRESRLSFPQDPRNRRKQLRSRQSQALRQPRTFMPVKNRQLLIRENGSQAISARRRVGRKYRRHDVNERPYLAPSTSPSHAGLTRQFEMRGPPGILKRFLTVILEPARVSRLLPTLRLPAQPVIGEDDRHHRFGHRNESRKEARIMTTFGLDRRRLRR